MEHSGVSKVKFKRSELSVAKHLWCNNHSYNKDSHYSVHIVYAKKFSTP